MDEAGSSFYLLCDKTSAIIQNVLPSGKRHILLWHKHKQCVPSDLAACDSVYETCDELWIERQALHRVDGLA